ncbi:cupin domain-containing protein [Methanosarcina sp. DH2]|jgi:predicted house-cleaning noncanonical NTP pyrophosphatase (MazG superfamily)/mannose-6-phosphate isomerase-like protein (cupin superfamily)|uniref:cupin domain-containing protein n=1 Tax=Methanosarcina sp. DH2 TaxID=2605639 RepID=UPI001E43B1B8|nr:cupin domain-containing protein [Methanosarcina sp. DH2]MCC4771070.1 cupin domain-containing protein [Methanosarcina sp. DH2]
MKSSTENGRKAVRDKIPEIIRNSGRGCATKELSDPGFLVELENKLGEELAEYLQSKELEELADLLEVIYRIAELRGASKESLEVLRLQKKLEKGGFEKNMLLLNAHDEKCLSPEFPADSEELPRIVFRRENAELIEKHRVWMRIYTTKDECKSAAVLYQETEAGHAEEFVHEKSDFFYYILEGSGIWVVEDREFEVRAGDVVVVPAGKRFWFRGNLKQICITAPAWEEKYERHIRDIEL